MEQSADDCASDRTQWHWLPSHSRWGSGQVAMGYIGTYNGGDTWNGYLSVIQDAFSDQVMITTVPE